LVKEIASYGGDVSAYMPAAIVDKLRSRLDRKDS
jgi:pantetheine-phosphate adenylyltransferase